MVIVATGAGRERSTVPGADHRLVVDGDDLRSMLTGSGDVSRALKKLPWFGRVAATAGRRLGLLNNAERLARLTQHYMPIGKRVAIIGGGLVGIELAEFMVDRGRAVTVLDDGPTMATEMAHPRRWRVLTDLRDHDATLVSGATVDEITDTEVRYTVGGSDTAEAVAVDSVVIATGLVSDLSVTDAFREAGLSPVAIGDCTGVGYLEGAIREGFLAGLGVG